MTEHSIIENYQRVMADIAAEAARCQRSPESVQLLAVSKTHPIASIRQAYQAGARDFGENYLQEALEKIRQLAEIDPPMQDVRWHFIGPVQSNKTRDIAAAFDWLHSVDRLKIARRLSEQRPDGLPDLNICLQVNLSGEDSKSGVALEEVPGLCEQIAPLPRLHLRGLMAIPAPTAGYEAQRAVFRPLSVLFRELQARYDYFDTLSIGMSADYQAAIAEGATIIRVGSAIFGARNR
jgi:pyridoxal phosphate enzyme (YggS family)